MDPKAFRTLSYGVYVVSTWDRGRPTGCTANCAVQVTAQPAVLMVGIHKDNYTNRCIADCGHFAVSVLAEDTDPAVIGTFGFRSGKDTDKFSGIPYEIRSALPVVKDSCAYIVCRVTQAVDTATHTLFLGEVIGAEATDGRRPMTYAYYHEVVKGHTAKNAPTYLAETDG